MAIDEQPPTGGTTARWRLPDIHPEGRIYVLAGVAAVLVSLVLWDFITWPLIGLTVWIAAFFRDPVRVTPQGDDLVIAPADGLVSQIARVPVPAELRGAGGLAAEQLVRVSIFMSVFDVHINRTPVAGTVRDVVYVSGKFLNADLDKASDENERQHLVIEARDGRRIGITQIAGIVSRRIVSFVKSGDIIASGQRIGLIRFGSRVDVYLPDDITCQLIVGQRTIAGETVVGRIGGTAPNGVTH